MPLAFVSSATKTLPTFISHGVARIMRTFKKALDLFESMINWRRSPFSFLRFLMILCPPRLVGVWKNFPKLTSALFFLMAWPSLSSALGFGPLNALSSLGEPLKIIIPLRLEGQETLSADCVKLVKNASPTGLAKIQDAKIVLLNQNKNFSLLITTTTTFEEPAAQLTVKVGCSAPVTRDFVVLLDPPLGNRLFDATAPANAAAANPTPVVPEKTAVANLKNVTSSPVGSAEKTSSEAHSSKKSRVPFKSASDSKKIAKSVSKQPLSVDTQVASVNLVQKKRRDRLLLAPGSSANTYQGFRFSDSLNLERLNQTSGAPTNPANLPNAADEAERARLLAILRGENYDVLMADKQANLVGQLGQLSQQTKQLQTQLQQETARRKAAEINRILFYGLAALLVLGLAAVFWWLRKKKLQQQLEQSTQQKEWWHSTQMPEEEVKVEFPEKELPEQKFPEQKFPLSPEFIEPETPLIKPLQVVDSNFENNKTERSFELEIEFPDRLQDSNNNIEVEELGDDDAIDVLQKTGRLNVYDLGITSTQVGVSASTELAELDFDLGGLDETPKSEVLENQDQSVRAVPFGQPGVPLSMEAARQAQKHMRQVAETIEQADAYIEADQNETAASVLRKFINEKPAIPRTPWLMLLTLYQKTGKREPYEALSVRFSRVYGRAALSWEHSEPPAQEIGLDSDPNLMQSIWAHWGTAESMELLLKQLYDTSWPDDKFFNLTLQRDLLNFAKICPLDAA